MQSKEGFVALPAIEGDTDKANSPGAWNDWSWKIQLHWKTTWWKPSELPEVIKALSGIGASVESVKVPT